MGLGKGLEALFGIGSRDRHVQFRILSLHKTTNSMATFHDEVEIEDFEFDEEQATFFYPCPCGDKFQITLVHLTP